MSSNSEIDRLARVYRDYKLSPSARRRWSLSNPGNRAILNQRRAAVRTALSRHGFLPLTGKRILDVGCGYGGPLGALIELGAQPTSLYGVDLFADHIAVASAHYPEVNFRIGNAETLAFPSDSFDLVLAFTLFSSILEERMARNVAREIGRVLKPGGAVIWYDLRYDNPRNPNIQGINLDRVKSLFPNLRSSLTTTTVLPPLARGLGPLCPAMYPILSMVPFMRTHLIGLLTKA